MRNLILDSGKRIDGRTCDEVRPINIEMGLLPRTHGSALFTRGETQSLAVCTLGGDSMGQRFETLDEDGKSSFYLQYSFPPFSVGEVGRMGPPGRREVGHGKLAERALQAGIAFLVETGTYCIQTGRAVKFTEKEIRETVAESPRQVVMGEGDDARVHGEGPIDLPKLCGSTRSGYR